MSIKLATYVSKLRADTLPQVITRFAENGMDCHFAPAFALEPPRDAGVVAVRMKLHAPEVPQYENADTYSELEIAFKDFRYASPLSVYPSINDRLKACSRQVVIRIHATYTSSFRVGMYFSAFLSEVAEGVLYAPRSDSYLDPEQAFIYAQDQVSQYETTLASEDWRILPFTTWP